MKKRFVCCLALALLFALATPAFAANLDVNAKAVVLMEKTTGEVLYEENAHEQLEPASVTKVMTMLLIMEALDSGVITKDTMIPVSATAAGMGGSQVYLKEGEEFPVNDMLKAIAVASGNDASVAMAEYLAGSESSFVEKMNAKAAELGMEDTTFQNCTGLPADGHHTSAYDIALMSRELILHHPDIRTYTTIWMDTIRDGAFQLANTNKLIRYYTGATGLKTGSTDSALYCLSATAEREGMELIAVIMKGATSPQRFEDAQTLLSHGFANYALRKIVPDQALPPVPVELGTQATVQPVPGEGSALLLEKAKAGNLTQSVTLEEAVAAPVALGDRLGTLTVTSGEEVVAEIPLLAGEEVPRVTYGQMFLRLLRTACLAG